MALPSSIISTSVSLSVSKFTVVPTSSISICSLSSGFAGPSALTITIGDYASGTDFIYDKSATLAADAKEEFITNILILEEQDTLKLLSDITGPDVTISLLEMNREDK